MTAIQASRKSFEIETKCTIRDKRKKRKPKFKIGVLVRTSNLPLKITKEIVQTGVLIFIQ